MIIIEVQSRVLGELEKNTAEIHHQHPVTSLFCNPMDCSLPGSSVHGIFPGKNTEVCCHFLLQGIFLTQSPNPHLLYWQANSLPLSHLGSPQYFIMIQKKKYLYKF